MYARIYIQNIHTYHTNTFLLPPSTHTRTGHGLDGSNEIQFFGQKILEASCPWSTYLKRFPNFGLQSRKSTSKVREMSSDKGGDKGGERGSAMATSMYRENSNKTIEKKNDNNKNSNINELKKNDNYSVIKNKNDTISDIQNYAAEGINKQMIEKKIISIKHRNLLEKSVNLSVTFSETVLERKLLFENTEMEYVSKAESVYTFDNSLDYIHSEVRGEERIECLRKGIVLFELF